MKLSVIITAYNVAPYIKQCIESVRSQDMHNHELEIIVVEDNSTDNTFDILQNINNIILYKNKVNVGAGLSRRTGIEHASGDYVMLLDGDDYLENTEYLYGLLNKAEMSDYPDVISGGIKILREDGSYDITSYGNYTCTGYEKIYKFWGERIVFMNNKIIKRSMYLKVPYCHRRYIEDTSVIIPILWYADKVEYIDLIGYVYRMRDDSLTHQSNELKNIIFKGLCWCDLLEFFNEKDPEVFKYIGIKNYIKAIFNFFNNTTISANEINPYANEFAELMLRMLNLIKINSIDFKTPQNIV